MLQSSFHWRLPVYHQHCAAQQLSLGVQRHNITTHVPHNAAYFHCKPSCVRKKKKRFNLPLTNTLCPCCMCIGRWPHAVAGRHMQPTEV